MLPKFSQSTLFYCIKIYQLVQCQYKSMPNKRAEQTNDSVEMFRMQTVNDDDEHTRALLRLKQEFMRRGLSDASTASFVYTCIDALGNELPISLPHQVLKKRFLNICAILLFTIFTFYHLGFAVVSYQKPKSFVPKNF